MEYFLKKENVEKYKKIVEGYDNSYLMREIKNNLMYGSSILELGMGTGKDLISLSEKYEVTGSDYSYFFLDEFSKKSNIKIQYLDAIDVNINGNFDCIYSNKVLPCLKKNDFIKSLENQYKYLNDEGILFFTLWHGKYEETYIYNDKLRIVKYNEDILKEIIPSRFSIKEISNYKECKKNDSLLVILQKCKNWDESTMCCVDSISRKTNNSFELNVKK